jgi:hypothetical protein
LITQAIEFGVLVGAPQVLGLVTLDLGERGLRVRLERANTNADAGDEARDPHGRSK